MGDHHQHPREPAQERRRGPRTCPAGPRRAGSGAVPRRPRCSPPPPRWCSSGSSSCTGGHAAVRRGRGAARRGRGRSTSTRGARPTSCCPLLGFIPDPGRAAARRRGGLAAARRRPLPNVGELGKIRLAGRGGATPQTRLAPLRERLAASGGEIGARSSPRAAARALKPRLVVRTPARFRAAFWRWAALVLAGFAAVHLVWLVRGFRGDPLVLPVLLVLTGLGLMLMVEPARSAARPAALPPPSAQGCSPAAPSCSAPACSTSSARRCAG